MGLCQPFALQGAMAARPVGRPWSSSGGDDDVCFHRTALVLALRSGLLQKALLEFAWDVQTTVEEMGNLLRASSVEELIGGSLVLARQVYASHAQQVVVSMALDLSRVQGRAWCSKSLGVLHSRLRGLTPRDSRKCRGRGPLHTGPRWLNAFLSKPGNMARFRLAAKLVGKAILVPSAEGVSFGELCHCLLRYAKLPSISLYGVVGLVRCVCAVRVSSGEESLVTGPECWSGYLRDMTQGSTKVGFDHFAVYSHADAMAMLMFIHFSN